MIDLDFLDMTAEQGGLSVVVLDDQPELLNQDAFANWIIKVELSDKSELDSLMDAKAYEAFCNQQ